MTNLWTEDDFQIVQNAAVGRRAFVLSSGTIELGDTELRDVTATMNTAGITSGRLLLGRVGDLVQLFLVDLLVAAGAPSSLVVQNQARTNQGMFYPKYFKTGRAIATSGSGTAVTGPGADVAVNTQLGVVLHGVTPGLTYQAALEWRTDAAWGNGLPGVADGQPI